MPYNLCPVLKQILEDKRIRRFGVPRDEYDEYLNAEQFVVDCRNYSIKEIEDIFTTYSDLKEMGLEEMPCTPIVIHSLHDPDDRDILSSENLLFVPPKNEIKGIASFYMSEKHGRYSYNLSESIEQDREISRVLSNKGSLECTSLAYHARLAEVILIVMLATRNVVKEHKECRTSQRADNTGKPHKKGSGGYTLVRTPEANETGSNDIYRTHGSPRPHFRRGHIRKIHPEDKTSWVFVSPCFVNGQPDDPRKAYLIGKNDDHNS